MEAGTHLCRATLRRIAMVGLLAISLASTSDAANFRTQNFIVEAPTNQLANAVGVAAEKYRQDLAVHWTGQELPAWPTPCPIRVIAGPTLAAQGVTTYNRAPVRDFQMEVVGTPERILDSVLPHEVTHTILATHFGRPLPRWADEGICTTVEHAAERNKHEAKLREFLRSRRGIAMNQLFLLTEYPNDVLPMYAQGYSVCRFLIDQQGPRTFINFLHDYMQRPSWTANVKKHYGYESLAELQQYWLAWVADGSGPVDKFAKSTPSMTPPAKPAAASIAMASRDTPVASNNVSKNAAMPGRAASPESLNSPNVATTPAATALASRGGKDSAGQGWYLRRRDNPTHSDAASLASVAADSSRATQVIEPPAGTGGKRSGAIRTMAPPSIAQSGHYSAAQPQPEQQMSRGGLPISDATRASETRLWR